jgi:hypothetical protein
MSAKSTCATAAKNITLKDVETLAAEYNVAGFQIAEAESAHLATLDVARKRYDAAVAPLKARQAEIYDLLHAWATLNKGDAFNERRSIVFTRAVLRWALAPHKVKLLARIKLGDVVDALKARPWGKDFLRFREPELNREALIDARDQISEDKLDAIGVRIVQEDCFSIDPPEI